MCYFVSVESDDMSNSYELSEEMNSVASNRKIISPGDTARTYFDQKIHIPRDEGVEDVSLF